MGLERPSFARRKVKLRSPSQCKTTRLRNALYQCDSLAFFFAEITKALFEKVQEMLCLCLREEIIGEEEFVLLYESIQAE